MNIVVKSMLFRVVRMVPCRVLLGNLEWTPWTWLVVSPWQSYPLHTLCMITSKKSRVEYRWVSRITAELSRVGVTASLASRTSRSRAGMVSSSLVVRKLNVGPYVP